MEMKCIKSVARVLNKDCVNKRGLDLSKNVLWVSVGQRGSRSTGCQSWRSKKNSADRPVRQNLGKNGEELPKITRMPP